MPKYLYADELHSFPRLRDSMFQDRAYQFKERLGWDVQLTSKGEQQDEYDAFNPLYVIWETEAGEHAGSMRLMPTTGRCMVNEHFTDILGGGSIESPFIWESTRFCLSQKADRFTAPRLMLAAGEAMVRYSVGHCLGVFDARMISIYRMIGASPDIIGECGKGKDYIGIGLWRLCDSARQTVSKIARVCPTESQVWFEQNRASLNAPENFSIAG